MSQSAAIRPLIMRKKRLAQNLALFFGTFLCCIAVLEVVLHLAGYGNLEVYQPDPKLYWKLKPNQQCYTKVNRKPVRINSLGTRGPEFNPRKPAGTFRILSLGDSRAFGWGLAEDETYSAKLGAMLQERVGLTPRIEVINAGVNAWSYAQMLVYFRDVALAYQPDVVLIGEANQWTQFSESNSPDFVKKFMWRVRLKNLLRRSATYHYIVELKLKDFYERHRARFIPIDPRTDTLFKAQQQADPYAVFRDALRGLCMLAQTNHVQPAFLFLPTEDEFAFTNKPALLEVKSGLAAELRVPLVDAREVLKAHGNRLYLDGDSVHFNERANDLIARALTSELRPVVVSE